MMFDFLKRKKEGPADLENPEESPGMTDISDTSASSLPDLNPNKPGFGSPEVTARDIQLVLARMELLDRKMDSIEKKLDEILEIAKEGK